MLVSRTDYLRKPFAAKGFEEAAWQKAYQRHSADQVRRHLRMVRAFAQGETMQQVAQAHQVQVATVRRQLKIYLQAGLKGVCAAQQRPRAGRLTAEQEAAFRQTLLPTGPDDHGLRGRIWTGQSMRQYVLQTWQVRYRYGIYDLLERLGLTHQKAHADYGNADPVAQRACLEQLKQTLLALPTSERLVAFDEFSVCEKPTASYGWAAKNTRPRFTTNEKKESASMAC